MSDEEDFAKLDKLATWMRKVGATRAIVSDIELVLGSEPIAQSSYPEKSASQTAAQRRQAQQNLLLAAAEGFPDSDLE